MQINEFPTELPTDKLSLLIDIARGKPVDKRQACLVAYNVVGYAADKLLPPTTFSSASPMASVEALTHLMASAPIPTADEVEEAVRQFHADTHGAVADAAKSGAGIPAPVRGGGALLVLVRLALPVLLRLLIK